MLISVITINYNNKEGLSKTIKSISSQTYSAIEYLIIDGGSTDGSVVVIEDNVTQISHWISEEDDGIYDAMNKGIRAATGDIITFVNSGDILTSEYSLQLVAKEIMANKAQIYFGNYIHFDCDTSVATLKNIPSVIYKSDLLSTSFAHPSSYYRKEVFQIAGVFNSNYRIVSDVDWYLNAIINHKIKFYQIPYASSVFFNDGVSSQNSFLLQQEYGIMINKYFSRIEIRLYPGRTFIALRKYIGKLFFWLTLKND